MSNDVPRGLLFSLRLKAGRTFRPLGASCPCVGHLPSLTSKLSTCLVASPCSLMQRVGPISRKSKLSRRNGAGKALCHDAGWMTAISGPTCTRRSSHFSGRALQVPASTTWRAINASVAASSSEPADSPSLSDLAPAPPSRSDHLSDLSRVSTELPDR